MFNIGFGELIVILLVAFLIVGPKDLPRIARSLAKGLKEIHGLSDEIKETVISEAEKKQFEEFQKDISDTAGNLKDLNPVTVVKKEVESLNPLTDLKDLTSSNNKK